MLMTTLDEVAVAAQQRAQRLPPAVAGQVLIEAPGLDEGPLARLKADLPELPESYLRCVSRLRFWNAQLGGFLLGPGAIREADLHARLVAANTSDDHPAAGLLRDRGLLQVAALEIDPICVRGRSGPGEPGEVVWIDVTSGPDPVVTPLAQDFETFLIVAARLDQAARVGADLDEVLDGFVSDPREREGWAAVASMIL